MDFLSDFTVSSHLPFRNDKWLKRGVVRKCFLRNKKHKGIIVSLE